MIHSSSESPQCIARSFALVMRSFAQSNTARALKPAGSFLFMPADASDAADALTVEPCPTICNGRWRLQCAGRGIASARLDAFSPAHRERSVPPSQIARVGTQNMKVNCRLIGCEVQMIRRATVRRTTLLVSRMSRLHGSYRSRSRPHGSAKCVARTGRDLRHPSPSISAPAPQQKTTPSCDDAKQRARSVLLRRGDAPGASCPLAFGRLPSRSALFGGLGPAGSIPPHPVLNGATRGDGTVCVYVAKDTTLDLLVLCAVVLCVRAVRGVCMQLAVSFCFLFACVCARVR
jgi:hypothetical protein